MAGSDLRLQYVYWRDFAFGQIRGGHFPLWNPYAFCGTPFFADPQSAMLYPPNWLHLLLPSGLAFSWLFVLHVFLAGWLMAIWCRRRLVGVGGALIAGTIYACSGPMVSNTMAGHLPLLCSAAWLPGLWICVDAIFDESPGRWRWTLMGMALVAMLALDGYPQFAYYSALAAGIYALLRMPGARNRWHTAAFLTLTFIGGWMLAAVQILASAQMAGESMRTGGLPLDIASSFSFPPENLLTLLTPGIFGDAASFPYFGRWYFWEATLYVGPAAAALAVCGAIFAPKSKRRFAGVMLIVMLVLALGVYTPLYELLYYALPGFSSFRGTARFGLIGLMFLAILSGLGFDEIARAAKSRRFMLFLIVIAAALVAASVWAKIQQSNGGGEFAEIIASLHMPRIPDSQAGLPDDGAIQAAGIAFRELVGAAVVVIATVVALAARSRIALAFLAIVPVIGFAFHERVSSRLYPTMPAEWSAALADQPRDIRFVIADDFLANAGAKYGFLNVRGFNPLVLGRFGKLMAAAHHADPDFVGLHLDFDERSPVDRICRYGADALPRLVLMGRYEVAADAEGALRQVADRAFDPAAQVVLEQPPDPVPQADQNPGTVRLLSESSDELEIAADLRVPQILLVTDSFSAGWRIEPIEQSSQANYECLAGDYAFRAIPLAAGHHHFRLEYRPSAYVVGKWISLAAIASYAIAWARLARGRGT